jgi:hypothetical protein
VLTVNVYFVDQDQDENGENMYLISPRYVPLVEESVRKVQLRLYVMPDGIYGLLPIKMTKNEKGRMYPQPASMLKVAAKYAGKWIRVKYVKALKVYQGVPMDVAVEPKFPEIPMMEIVNRAYEDRLINRRDHPILVDQVGPGA